MLMHLQRSAAQNDNLAPSCTVRSPLTPVNWPKLAACTVVTIPLRKTIKRWRRSARHAASNTRATTSARWERRKNTDPAANAKEQHQRPDPEKFVKGEGLPFLEIGQI